jgi:hypothetical protein
MNGIQELDLEGNDIEVGGVFELCINIIIS